MSIVLTNLTPIASCVSQVLCSTGRSGSGHASTDLATIDVSKDSSVSRVSHFLGLGKALSAASFRASAGDESVIDPFFGGAGLGAEGGGQFGFGGFAVAGQEGRDVAEVPAVAHDGLAQARPAARDVARGRPEETDDHAPSPGEGGMPDDPVHPIHVGGHDHLTADRGTAGMAGPEVPGAMARRRRPALPRPARATGTHRRPGSGAYYGYIRALQPGGLPGVNPFAGISINRETVETYLGSFASTPDELADKLDACPGPWQMLPIQDRPLLRIGEVIFVLDEQHLIERATQGLYWFVHEKEHELDGQRGGRDGTGPTPPWWSGG